MIRTRFKGIKEKSTAFLIANVVGVILALYFQPNSPTHVVAYFAMIELVALVFSYSIIIGSFAKDGHAGRVDPATTPRLRWKVIAESLALSVLASAAAWAFSLSMFFAVVLVVCVPALRALYGYLLWRSNRTSWEQLGMRW